MGKAISGVRMSAAAFVLGVSFAGPQAMGVAAADSPDADSATVSSVSREQTGIKATARSNRSAVARSGRAVAAPGAGSSRPESAPSAGVASASASAAVVARSAVEIRSGRVGQKSGVVSSAPTPLPVLTAADLTDDPVGLVSLRPAVTAVPQAASVAGASLPEVDRYSCGNCRATVSAPGGIASATISIGRVLDEAVRWLSSFSPNPLADLLAGAVWLIRRTLVATGDDVEFGGSAGCVVAKDCSGQDLSGANLSGQDLRGVNFTGTILTRADLSDATMRAANLTGATLTEATLTSANLTDANLTSANLTRANISDAIFDRVTLRAATLAYLDLTARNFSGFDLSFVNLEGTNLTGADLSGANLSDTDLRSANLAGASIRGINLSRADLSGQNLAGAVLTGANLTDAKFVKTNLNGANLESANLENTNFYQANLTNANLTGAVLKGTDLRSVALRGANLTGVDLSRKYFLRDVGIDLTGVNLTNANLSRSDLTGVDLTGANLTGVNLTGATLTKTRLIGTTLTGVNLTGLDLSGLYLNKANLTNANLTSASLEYADLTGANLTQADLTNAVLVGTNLINVTWSGTTCPSGTKSDKGCNAVPASAPPASFSKYQGWWYEYRPALRGTSGAVLKGTTCDGRSCKRYDGVQGMIKNYTGADVLIRTDWNGAHLQETILLNGEQVPYQFMEEGELRVYRFVDGNAVGDPVKLFIKDPYTGYPYTRFTPPGFSEPSNERTGIREEQSNNEIWGSVDLWVKRERDGWKIPASKAYIDRDGDPNDYGDAYRTYDWAIFTIEIRSL